MRALAVMRGRRASRIRSTPSTLFAPIFTLPPHTFRPTFPHLLRQLPEAARQDVFGRQLARCVRRIPEAQVRLHTSVGTVRCGHNVCI